MSFNAVFCASDQPVYTVLFCSVTVCGGVRRHDGRANSFLLGPCDVADEDMLWAKVQSVGDISEQSIPSREE